jgi:uncharacterized protein (DUF2249 family)
MAIHYQILDPLVRFWMEEGKYHLDVRSILASGGKPYDHIMSCVDQIRDGDTLVVHALFEPKPLVTQLAARGLRCVTRLEAEDHWTVTIHG